MSNETKYNKIRVLIVDDSLFMRQLIARMLDSAPDIEVVDTAKDGKEALTKIAQQKPDVITLDLAMPKQHGLSVLKNIMLEYPTPVVILSAYSQEDADITLQCLDAGAVSFILKPSGELSLNIEDIKDQLIEELRAASEINVGKIKSLISRKAAIPPSGLAFVDKVVVIGASTGGPQTLEVILSMLPADFPAPIIVVQHMPARAFTESIARRFKKTCDLVVKLAEDGDSLYAGTVYLIPGGCHSVISKEKIIRLHEQRATSDDKRLLTPSIDEVMGSIAKVFGKKVLGVILTGMGYDGLEGMKAIKVNKGKTVVQDESALIFGMPKEIIDAGLADEVLPVEKIAKSIVDFITR